MKISHRYALAALLGVAAHDHAVAQTIAIEAADGVASTAKLASESHAFLAALANYAYEHSATGELNRTVRAKAISPTLAVVEYKPPGNKPSMVVHARSGRSLEGTWQQLTKKQGGSGSESEAGLIVSADEEDRDLSEARYYPPETTTSIRARNIRQRDGWVVQSYPEDAGNYIHGGDAELKAMRTLEERFQADPSLRGGTLKAWVSQDVCHSCERAFSDFAREYNVRGSVYYLGKNMSTVPGVPVGGENISWSGVLQGIRKTDAIVVLGENLLGGTPLDYSGVRFDATRILDAEDGVLVPGGECG